VRVLVALFATLALATPTMAGEIVGFQPGKPAAPVLQQTRLRAVIADFLDPGGSGMGNAISLIIWREVLTAIADQAGAGVILAKAPGNRPLVDLLQERYHEAALDAARSQAARMAVWGSVEEHDGRLFVSTYLSIIPDARSAELMLRLEGQPPLGADVAAEIPHSRLNLPLVETKRQSLLQRSVVMRNGAVIRKRPDSRAAEVTRPAVGSALEVSDLVDGWFKVDVPNLGPGYVHHSVVDVPPQLVDVRGATTRLSSAPGGRAGSPVPPGSYRVVNMRYAGGSGLSYEIAVSGARGWVLATAVRPRFSLPVVHLVAGLYRYQLGRYAEARGEFEQYLASPGVDTDNASLAMVYQLLGASQVVGKDALSLRSASAPPIEAFTRAIELTPYDPAAYNLRAVAVLALRGRLGEMLPDLAKATDLDPDNPRARSLITLLNRVTTTGEPSGLRRLVADANDRQVRDEVARLARRADGPSQ